MPAPAQWHKLDRDRTIAMINSVKAAGGHALFSPGTSEAKCARLPFYRNLLLYRLTNYASLPSFSFNYLGDGHQFVQLTGAADAIYHANASGNLALSESNVLDYVVFFFDHVSGPDGDIHVLAENTELHPALESLGYTGVDDILSRYGQPVVAHDGAGHFIVDTPMYYLGMLVRARVIVDETGRVDVVDSQMLLSSQSSTAEQGISL